MSELKTKLQWRREGRQVGREERSQKVLRGGTTFAVYLYGYSQTEDCPEAVPSTQGGPIPGVSEHGSIDIRTAVLHPGTVHVSDDAARTVAARCGIEFAPALVGFTKERGQVKPKYGGVVVWERDRADLDEGIEKEREVQEEIRKKKHNERMEAAWRLLAKNVLVDVYVEERFGAARQSLDGGLTQ